MLPQKNVIDEIKLLHEQFVALSTEGIEKAFRIGELLTEQKALLQHGEWIPWIEQNLPFNRVTAANYMRLFKNKAALNVQGVVHLAEAYQILAGPPREISVQEEELPESNAFMVMEIPDEVMQMGAKLEEMQEGEHLTGYAHYDDDDKKRANFVTIVLLPNERIYYEFVILDSINMHSSAYHSEMTIYDFIEYMAWKNQNRIKINGITWMYPGFTQLFGPGPAKLPEETITFNPDNA